VNDILIKDLNFADDIAVLEDTWHRMAEITMKFEKQELLDYDSWYDKAHDSRRHDRQNHHNRGLDSRDHRGILLPRQCDK